MAVVWFRLRTLARLRWRAWLTLAALVGLGGGIVLGALAGARRTDSAYGRFLEGANAFDVAVVAVASPIDVEAVRRLPQVTDSAGLLFLLMEAQLDPIAPAGDGLFDRINRPQILEGRRPDPSRADEVSISRLAATTFDLGIGDTVAATAFRPDQKEAVLSAGSPVAAGPSFTFRIVGIDATPTEFLPSSPNSTTMHLTPAFTRIHGGEVASVYGLLLQLRGGATDLGPFKQGVEQIAGAAPLQFVTADADTTEVQRSIHLQAIALRLFAALTAIAAVLIVGQAFGRQTTADVLDYPTLRALGMTRRQLWAVAMAQAGTIAGIGAVVAVVVAYALSAFSPIGIAGDAEPTPGLSFDATTLLVGGAAIVLLALVLVAVPTWARSRPGPTAGSPADRPSRLLESLASMGLPVPAVTGLRMAVSPGRRQSSAPVRNAALVSTIFCISAVLVVATYGASLRHMLDTPRLYGWDWDLLVGNPYLGDIAEENLPALTENHSVAGVSTIAFADIDIQGARATALGFGSVLGEVLPPVVEGRAPLQPDEVLVGTKTLRDLGSDIGRTVTARVGDRSAEVRIVGRGVLPGIVDALDVGALGEGVLFTDQGLRRLVPDAPRNLFAVRFRPGVDTDDATRQVADAFPYLSGPTPPKSVADFGRVDAMPAVLAGLLTLLAMATLAHATLTAVRSRRRELAILKTLGFVRSQVQATVAFQATALMVVALAVGVPLGVGAGRWTWRVFAESLGIVPAPVLPLTVFLGIVPVAILVANLIAAGPGRTASRVQPSTALQAE